MMWFVLRMTICLQAFYLFYGLVLQKNKTFKFNRFYLLLAVLSSILIPLLSIPSSLHLFGISEAASIVESQVISSQDLIRNVAAEKYRFSNLYLILYILISGCLLVRFSKNAYDITLLAHRSPKAILRKSNPKNETKIVLVNKKTLPYSFFNYVFVNRREYENNEVPEEVIIHEQAHCQQKHSLDVIFMELLIVFLWFHPMIWLFKRSIQLNHEFLADDQVITSHATMSYQSILLNLVYQNNSTILVSNINFSLTKKRLIMMNKEANKNRNLLVRLAIIPLLLLLVVTMTIAQENKNKDNQETEVPIMLELEEKNELKKKMAAEANQDKELNIALKKEYQKRMLIDQKIKDKSQVKLELEEKKLLEEKKVLEKKQKVILEKQIELEKKLVLKNKKAKELKEAKIEKSQKLEKAVKPEKAQKQEKALKPEKAVKPHKSKK